MSGSEKLNPSASKQFEDAILCLSELVTTIFGDFMKLKNYLINTHTTMTA